MGLKVSKNLQSIYKEPVESDEEFLKRISSGKSLYNEDIEYEYISKGIFIYPLEKVKQLSKNPYNNIISAKLVGEVRGTKLVEIEFERLVPSQRPSYHRW